MSLDLLLAVIVALCGGILPSLIWLFFWLRTDEKNPEPPHRILWVFALGTLCVPIAYFLEYQIISIFLGADNSPENTIGRFPIITALVIVILALIEETLKYFSARQAALQSRDNNEPIDASVYLVTVALGFAAMENFLFILEPIVLSDFSEAFFVGNLRFVGASLLHVASSAILGICISLSFGQTKKIRSRATLLGIILATGLHALFNIFIIRNEKYLLLAFAVIWLIIMLVIVLFEKIKRQKIKIQ